MAVLNPPLAVQSRTDTNADDHRRSLTADLTHGAATLVPLAGVMPGVGGELVVAAGAGLSVTVASGIAVLPAPTPGHGGWHAVNDGTLSLSLAASNATNPRIDLVIVRVADPTYYAGGDGLAAIRVVTGIAAPSPAVPPVPSTDGAYLVLGQVYVAAGATTISSANVSKAAYPDVPRARTNSALYAQATTDLPLLVRGTTAQTANLSEWRDVTGAAVASIDPMGTARVANLYSGNVLSVGGVTTDTGPVYNAHLAVRPLSAGAKAAVIRATTGQTARLTEWQHSNGTALAWVDADGRLTVSPATTTARGTGVAQFTNNNGAPAVTLYDGTRVGQIGLASITGDFIGGTTVGSLCLVPPAGSGVWVGGPLQVQSNVGITGAYFTTNSALMVASGDNAHIDYNSNGAGGFFVFSRPGVAWSTLQAAAFSVQSSLSLKTNVTDADSLSLVRRLHVVDYNYRPEALVDTEQRHTGLLAEEAVDVYPAAVTIDGDGTPVGIDYSKLTGPLLRAVQQLADRVDALEARLAAA